MYFRRIVICFKNLLCEKTILLLYYLDLVLIILNIFPRCEQCVAFKNCSEGQKKELNVKYTNHQKNKREVRRLMKEDKARSLDDPHLCVANFDLQKILTTPRSDVSIMYYMSKLCVWNFTIFEMGVNIGSCWLWNETIGKRGSNEIASFVQNFIKDKCESTETKEIRFYTDNCGGQNRNQNLFTMYVRPANTYNVTIIHR